MATLKLKPTRAGAVRIALYNHKGGVGKTTLTVNIAHALLELGKRVLLVDSDPQCNLTAYLIEANVVDDLLDQSDSSKGQTLWSAVKPIVEAEGDIKLIEPFERRKNLFILPGDIRLSEFENELLGLWTQCLERKAKGFRGVTALSQVVDQTCHKQDIDFVFYDVGPNIGPLNRIILLDCDFFVIPVACDLFSMRAQKTLGHALSSWINGWRTIEMLAPDGVKLLQGTPRFIGYIPQGFRTYGGEIAKGYAKFVAGLERQIQEDVLAVLKKIDSKLLPHLGQLRLGEVKGFSSGVPASQLSGGPIWEVNELPEYQRNEAHAAFMDIAKRIIQRSKL